MLSRPKQDQAGDPAVAAWCASNTRNGSGEGVVLGVGRKAFKGHVAFENVSFAYASRPHDGVLDGVSLEAAPGETVAIVGKSGSGKSTLIACVANFYQPTSGQVLLDGIQVVSGRKLVSFFSRPIPRMHARTHTHTHTHTRARTHARTNAQTRKHANAHTQGFMKICLVT